MSASAEPPLPSELPKLMPRHLTGFDYARDRDERAADFKARNRAKRLALKPKPKRKF